MLTVKALREKLRDVPDDAIVCGSDMSYGTVLLDDVLIAYGDIDQIERGDVSGSSVHETPAAGLAPIVILS